MHLQFVAIITTLSWFSFECKIKIHLKPNSLETGAEAAKKADNEDDPDPENGTALAIYREGSQAKGGRDPSLLVAVGHILQTLAVQHTFGAIELLHKALDLLVGFGEGVLDVIFGVTCNPVGCKETNISFILITDGC